MDNRNEKLNSFDIFVSGAIFASIISCSIFRVRLSSKARR